MQAGPDQDGQNGEPVGQVFVSYSRDDLEHARPVIALLESAGLKVWWDGLLAGGDNYLPTTEAALEGADCVVALWSKTSVQSHWVRDEAGSGRDRRRLVPLSLDGTMPPLGFRQFQMIDISHWNGKPGTAEAEKVLEAVKAQCGLQHEPSPLAQFGPERFRVSRRAMAAGGLGLAGAAALGAWRLGLFSPRDAGTVSIAVLPFSNLSGNAQQAWFSDGLSDELRAVLARNPLLRVSAPTSSSSVSDGPGADDFAIGRKLGVRNILRGSVQRVAEEVRVSAELVRVKDGRVRWADTYDRKLQDVFAVQSEIARTVAMSLVAGIAGEEAVRRSIGKQEEVGGTRIVAAYDAYLRGSAFYDLSTGRDSDRAALSQFDAAIAADPDYAAAHAMRAMMLASLANNASSAREARNLFDTSIAAAKRAIALAPGLAPGHVALGFGLSNGRLDTGAALPEYKQARELAPGDADVQRSVAVFYSYGDQIGEATGIITRVLALDPLNARAFRSAGAVAYSARDYTGAISRMEHALALNPQLASANYFIGSARYQQGDAAGALKAFKAEPVRVFALTGTAIAKGKLGDRAAAEAALAQAIAENGDGCLYQQAQILAQWGESDRALSALERAFTAFDPGLLFLQRDPMLDPLRDAQRFKGLLSRLAT